MDSSEDGTQMWNGNDIVKLHLKSYRIQFHRNRVGCSKDSFLMQAKLIICEIKYLQAVGKSYTVLLWEIFSSLSYWLPNLAWFEFSTLKHETLKFKNG